MSNRTLTDEDVDAIVAKLKAELVTDFYGEVGRGVWGWAKKFMIAALFALALYGMSGGKIPSAAFEVRP